MKIIFLGTGSMIPTLERNHPSTLISYNNENILIDCGEATQLQLKKVRISPAKITKILITHWHPDHILGLPGLIATLGASNYQKELEIYGPKNTKKFFNNLFKAYIPSTKIKHKVIEIEKRRFFENDDFILEALPLKHSCPCLGYSFIEKDKRNINLNYLKKYNLKQHPILRELQKGKDITWKGKKIKANLATKIKKGKKITIITDTLEHKNIIELAKNSDILILESTHMDELKERTKEFMHLTSKQSALLAKKAKAKKLILTHFSQRYKNIKLLEKEAKSIFKNTIAAKDLLIYEL